MIIRLSYFAVAAIVAYLVVMFASDAARLNAIASETLNVEHSTELAWKSVLESLSFSLYSGASEAKAKTVEIFGEADRRENLAIYLAIGFGVCTLAFVALRWSLSRREPEPIHQSWLADLLYISIVCLVVGLIAPIMTLKAFAEVPVIGEVVLKFQSKSILTTITGLFASGNYFIALLVGLFSVVTPVAKIGIAVAIVQRRSPAWHQRGVDIVKAIGKWSMADVFVVAILVAYFAVAGDDFSEARLGLGLYFFAAYCVLSQFATSQLLREDP